MKHKYRYSFIWAKGRWYGKGRVIPIGEFNYEEGELDAYSERQARFFIYKMMYKGDDPIYIADLKIEKLEGSIDSVQLSFL